MRKLRWVAGGVVAFFVWVTIHDGYGLVERYKVRCGPDALGRELTALGGNPSDQFDDRLDSLVQLIKLERHCQ